MQGVAEFRRAVDYETEIHGNGYDVFGVFVSRRKSGGQSGRGPLGFR